MFKPAATTAVFLFTTMAAHATTTAQVADHVLRTESAAIFEGTNADGAHCTAALHRVGDDLVADVDETTIRLQPEQTAQVSHDREARVAWVQVRGESGSIHLMLKNDAVKSITVSHKGLLYGANESTCDHLIALGSRRQNHELNALCGSSCDSILPSAHSIR